jgi:hypothetical protein
MRARISSFMKGYSSAIPFALAAVVLAAATRSGAQTKYATGQDVAPVFEGWERNADGTFNMVFGYMNRNYEEQVEIPISPNNKMEPGPLDQGQPTHFYTRRQEFVFKVRVPKDWGDQDLVWTLISADKINKTYGTLRPVWEIGNMVYQENRGGPGDLTYPGEPNQAPSIEMVGSAQRTVVVGEALTLTVQVNDDGHPVPRARRPGAAALVRGGGVESGAYSPKLETPITQAVVKLEPGVRLGVTWVVYRAGPGTVTFNPMRVPVVTSGPPGSVAVAEPLVGKATTKVTFSQPGTYRLRAYADDGVLVAPLDVTVTVQAQ